MKPKTSREKCLPRISVLVCQLWPPTITVPVSALFETWNTTAECAQYGSAFTYTQLFTLSGPATAVGGVGVTLTNTIGTSSEVT
jgi:hypothetical protein